MDVSRYEGGEIASLHKTNRILKSVFIVLFAVTIIPLTITIVYAHKKNSLEAELGAKRRILSSLQLELKEQNYIYEFSDMNISQFSIQLDRNSNSKPIRVVELQHNQLTQFANNSIPGLQVVILDDNPLVTMSNNYLPDVNNLSITTGVFRSFSNNSLQSVKSIPGTLKAVEFRLNRLTVKNLDLKGTGLFQDNKILNLQTLKISVNISLIVRDSYMPKLKSFEVFRLRQQEPTVTTLISNTFGEIILIDWNCSALQTWKFLNNQYPLLESIRWFGTPFIRQFDGSYLPSLTKFVMDCDDCEHYPGTLESFCNNTMPLLAQLHLPPGTLVVNISNNSFPAVKSVNVTRSPLGAFKQNRLLSLQSATLNQNLIQDFGMVAPQLKYLDISNNSLLVLANLTLPSLKTFLIYGNRNNFTISNVTLPSLQQIDAHQSLIESIQILNATNLTLANIKSNQLLDFECHWPSVQNLSLASNLLSKFNATRYTKLMHLDLSRNMLSSIQLGLSKSLKTLNLDNNLLTFFNASFYSSLAGIEVLSLSGNELSDLNVEGQFLQQLSCSNCNLTNIKRIDSPTLKILDLSNNNLTVMSNFELNSLRVLDLTNNVIREFSNNRLKNLSSINQIDFSLLEKFQNNEMTYYNNVSGLVSFRMKSNLLHVFDRNYLSFGLIHFNVNTSSLKEIYKNTIAVSNNNVTILSPNLQSFTQNSLLFCEALIINGTSMTSFQNNTMVNVKSLLLANNSIVKFNNNILKGAIRIDLDNNKLKDDVVSQLVNMNVSSIQVGVNTGNNVAINKTSALEELQKAYPQAVIYL